MSSSPPKKKSSGSSHRRDLRLHDGGGHDDRLRRATSTSLDVAPALHGQGGIIDVNPVPFQVRRDTDVDLPDDSVARGNIEIPEGSSRDHTTDGVDSANEKNSRNDTDGEISMLTNIFNAKGYTRDQLLAVYKHQGRNLHATVTYIVGRESEAPNIVVGNLSNVMPSFGRVEDVMNAAASTLADEEFARHLHEEDIRQLQMSGGGVQQVHNAPYARGGVVTNNGGGVISLLDEDCNVPQPRQPMSDKDKLLLRVTNELTKRQSSANKDSYSAEFFKTNVIDPLMKHKTTLLTKAQEATKSGGQASLYSDLKTALPSKIGKSPSKADSVRMAVRVWVILSEILKTVKLSRETDHDLSTYIVLMEQTFDNCMSAMIDEASNNDDMKKIKIPQVEETRGYCQDGAKKPKHPYHTCPKCQAPFVHEPPETVAIREGNKVKKLRAPVISFDICKLV